MIVLDASAAVDLLVDAPARDAIAVRIAASPLVAPTTFDAEVFSALARLARAGTLPDARVPVALSALVALNIDRRPLAGLLHGSWARRGSLRLADALYVELAAQLGTVVVTTDARLARATPLAEYIAPPTLEP